MSTVFTPCLITQFIRDAFSLRRLNKSVNAFTNNGNARIEKHSLLIRSRNVIIKLEPMLCCKLFRSLVLFFGQRLKSDNHDISDKVFSERKCHHAGNDGKKRLSALEHDKPDQNIGKYTYKTEHRKNDPSVLILFCITIIAFINMFFHDIILQPGRYLFLMTPFDSFPKPSEKPSTVISTKSPEALSLLSLFFFFLSVFLSFCEEAFLLTAAPKLFSISSSSEYSIVSP